MRSNKLMAFVILLAMPMLSYACNGQNREVISQLVADTYTFLKVLNDNNDYGEISWPNSLTIPDAIEKIDILLLEQPEYTRDDVLIYSDEMESYFKDYISSDLNDRGMIVYTSIISRQANAVKCSRYN